jgi:BirA family transcriptional regulator, biotin operon repressor / biotin---[acetyl-CoA-carboxylase] ligase
MWQRVEFVAETGSTNNDLREHALNGAAHGSVLVTDFQITGKGRLARQWVAPPRSGLLFSALVRPGEGSHLGWGWLPLAAAVAVHDALRAFGVDVGIKWPNDILSNETKVAGLLTERLETHEGLAAIIGIGVNVSQRSDELPSDTATSLRILGHDVDRESLLVSILGRLAVRFEQWELGQGEQLRTSYLEASATLGREVRVELPSGDAVVGTASGLDEDGRLIVATQYESVVLAAGDVTHLRHRE